MFKEPVMKRYFLTFTAMCALALPMAASAQDADEIIVQGERVDRSEARGQARDITPRSSGWGDPLARFQKPICVGVWGLLPENAGIVIDRVYENAERVGIPIEETEGCAANVWAIFVDDPQKTFADLRRENSFMVEGLPYFERERIEEERGPSLAWNVVSTRNREGEVISIGDVDPGSMAVNPVTSMSRLQSAVRNDIEWSVVLIARSALADLDAHSVADYVTMRALARTETPDPSDMAFSTIMTLFDEGADRLTDFDLAYLRDLYSSSPLQPGRQTGGRIAAFMDEQGAGNE